MDNFEKNIKSAFEDFEANYDASHWADLNQKLGAPKTNLFKIIGGSAAVIAIVATAYYFYAPKNQNTDNLAVEHSTPVQYKNENGQVENETTIQETTSEVNSGEETSTKVSDHQTSTELQHNQNSSDYSSSEINHNNTNNTNNQQNNTIHNLTINPEPNVVDQQNTQKVGIKPEQAVAVVICENTTQCQNETFEFRPSVPKQNAKYVWDMGDGKTLTGGFVDYEYNKAGTYFVTLTLRDFKTNEVIKSSEALEVTVYPTPQPNFSFEYENNISPLVKFNNESENATQFSWDIIGVTKSNAENFEFTFKQKGEYAVRLTCSNENGCKGSVTKTVTIEKDYNLLAPNAFSPNGDNLNDYFIPKALPLLNVPFTMVIYDRKGQLVYQTTDANKPWDGLYTKDGIPAPDDVYIWVVQLTNDKGELETFQGQITIAR
ncbi:MAG: PKD domain-containing protein [Putridiphycobacter sp.]